MHRRGVNIRIKELIGSSGIKHKVAIYSNGATEYVYEEIGADSLRNTDLLLVKVLGVVLTSIDVGKRPLVVFRGIRPPPLAVDMIKSAHGEIRILD